MLNNKYFYNNVCYQIYPRSFCDSNNDGIGDIQGIISKLDYLENLGVGILWISPLYPSPNKDNGYDVSNYYDINPEYGSLSDFKILLSEAKKRNIRIVMDLVINHTSTEHPYFINSINKDSDYHNFYIWKKGKNKRKPPNNWQSIFGGTAWEYCPINDEYYLHLYSKEQADMNFSNPKVIQEVKNIMIFWLDLGVYGFRLDVINQIYKTGFKNGKKHLLETGEEHYLSQVGSHLILKEINKDILSKYDCMTVGECYKIDVENAKKYTTDELDMIFQFDHMNVDKHKIPLFSKRFRLKQFKRILFKWQQELDWNANYLENHDQGRSVTRFGDKNFHDESAKALAMILLCLRGTPFIYQGEEIGMINDDLISIKEVDDVAAKEVYKLLHEKLHFTNKYSSKIMNRINRDHARETMQWNKDKFGGFSKTKPWIKTNSSYLSFNVEEEIKDSDSILSFYRQLIFLRKNNDVLINGSFIPLLTNSSLIAFQREYNGQTFQIMVNLSKKTIKNPLYCDGKVLLSNYNRKSYKQQKKLSPFECALLKL